MDLTGLEPVERRSTAAIVADRLREAIMRGTFPPGTQLGEVELATRLGVSRGPLREAMQWLVAEGLLRSVRNRGLFVRDLDAADVRDVYAARAAVERAAGLLLIAGDRAAAVVRLSASLAAMEAAAGDPVALADADHAFHHELVAASGSPRLQRMADTLLVETRMCLAALQDNPPPAEDLLAEHRALLDAVRTGDVARLTTVLEAHMADAVDRILAPAGESAVSA
ncbi:MULTISPECIES: GntR family transcriptional regulator [unclassified Pseudonocardia]|jgi:DNA-binding GntR family transcriptional regulator|uniref:GntR family transcriptional regulator n=1 Tax=unclassified Pseudonocardia TaxID=2619320 RepID=UPI00095D590D|nr:MULTISPECIES: GntR family transcriptional regulator [unclassified Pseudonocardia]MBN9099548.1 GntR family transcriptional regulator [Pseudonocardia sp.]OJY43614.1 MAG: GntR family transcriptional regulator [Pseudonocardia sp. 73-21]